MAARNVDLRNLAREVARTWVRKNDPALRGRPNDATYAGAEHAGVINAVRLAGLVPTGQVIEVVVRDAADHTERNEGPRPVRNAYNGHLVHDWDETLAERIAQTLGWLR